MATLEGGQMEQEYLALIDCYDRARTYTDVARCQRQAEDFTRKWGFSQVLLTVTLSPEEKQEVTQCLNQAQAVMTEFRSEYYRQKPEFQRQARQAVRSAEANLNAMDASFDELREFLGLKSMVAAPVTLMSEADAVAKYFDCFF